MTTATAYMARVSNSWQQGSLTVNGHTLVVNTVIQNPSTRLVFMRLSDRNSNGSGFRHDSYESLEKLWTGVIPVIHAVDGSSSYTREDLINTLFGIMAAYGPDTIRAQAYVGRYGDGDHSDHHSTAYFTQAANELYNTSGHELIGYLGYLAANYPDNVFGDAYTAKENTFLTYAAYDGYSTATRYGKYFSRQYTVGTIITGPSTSVPTPSSGAVLRDNQILDASASDPSGVTKVEFHITGGALNDAPIATASETFYGWIPGWDTTAVPDGNYTLRSVAYDSGGNTGQSAPCR